MNKELEEWWEEFEKDNANPQSKEEIDKWWNSISEQERQSYIIDANYHFDNSFNKDLLILQSKWTILNDILSDFKFYIKEGIINEFEIHLQKEIEEYKRMIEQTYKLL